MSTARTRRRSVVAALTAVAVALTGCTDPGGSDSLSEAARIVQAVQLPATTTHFGTLPLTGLPREHAENATLWLHTAEGDAPTPIYGNTPNGQPHIVVSYFYPDPFAGGTLEFTLELEGERSARMPVQVPPLPRADGAWDDVMDSLHGWLDARAIALGTSLDAIVTAHPNDLTVFTLPIRLAYSYLQNDSGDDLRNLPASGGIPDPALLDAIIAQSGMAAEIDRLAAAEAPREVFSAARSGPLPNAATPDAVVAAASAAPTVTPLATVATETQPDPFSEGLACTINPLTIHGAQELADAIGIADAASIEEGGALDTVEKDLGTAASILGFVPGVGAYAAAGGTILTIMRAYRSAQAGIYPNLLRGLNVEGLDTTPFQEDFTRPQTWTRVTVDAVADGWRMGADILDGLLALLGNARGLAFSKFGVDDATSFAFDVLANVPDTSAKAVLDLVDAETGIASMCGKLFSGIDVTGDPWTSGRPLIGRFEVDSEEMHYQPKLDVGPAPFDDTLRIEVNPNRFSGRTAHSDHTVSVRYIGVEADRQITVPKAGDRITIDATVHNAWDYELIWETPEGGWVGAPKAVDTGGDLSAGTWVTWKYEHETPRDEDAYPYIIVLESAASTGLRASGTPPRLTEIEVKLGGIKIIPDELQMTVESTSVVAAVDTVKNEPVDVEWRVSSGTIAPTGDLGKAAFTAPDRVGTQVIITATSKENPEQTATAVVTLVGADAKDHVIVQVGNWSHTYFIPDFDRDMCKIWPQNGIITVRDETDDSEFFELKLDEPGWNGVSFGLESDLKFFVAGGETARLMAEGFGTTTPIPAIDPSMFVIERGFASGTVAMLDLINDRVETVTITANCASDRGTP